MGTRAAYKFTDENGSHCVYGHWDGYPSGAADYLSNALKSGLVWELPRFEADEFACGFIAANKTGPGTFRQMSSENDIGGTEYLYCVTCEKGSLKVEAFDGGPDPIFVGSVEQLSEYSEDE